MDDVSRELARVRLQNDLKEAAGLFTTTTEVIASSFPLATSHQVVMSRKMNKSEAKAAVQIARRKWQSDRKPEWNPKSSPELRPSLSKHGRGNGKS